MMKIEEAKIPRAGVIPQQVSVVGGVQYTKVPFKEKGLTLLRPKSPTDEALFVLSGAVRMQDQDCVRDYEAPAFVRLPEGREWMLEAREELTAVMICRALPGEF